MQNLGIVLAETGRKVLLVDADFRRPNLHHKFGLPNEWGLIDLLCEDLLPGRILARNDWKLRPEFRACRFCRIGSRKTMSQKRFIRLDCGTFWRC